MLSVLLLVHMTACRKIFPTRDSLKQDVVDSDIKILRTQQTAQSILQIRFVTLAKGSCQVKKIQKFEKNSDWPDTTHPPPYPICYFSGNMYNKQKTQKKHTKIQNLQKKEIIRVVD